VRPTKETYPIEAILRPLTLTEGQAEVLLDVPFLLLPDLDELGEEQTARRVPPGAAGRLRRDPEICSSG
jgi:hypothetical protein